MAQRPYKPEEPLPLAELGEGLRQAVELVRQSPLPADSLQRALQRASGLGQPRPPRPWLPRSGRFLAAAGVAALLLFGVGGGLTPPYRGGTLPRDGSDRLAGGFNNGGFQGGFNFKDGFNGGFDAGFHGGFQGGFQGPSGVGDHPIAFNFPRAASRHDTQRDWLRFRALRGLGQGMSSVDRAELDRYLRTRSGSGPTEGFAVWHRDRSRPRHARIFVGAGQPLDLVALRVSVLVEGPRARTVVDHVFRNPNDRPLEGTFEYPLPTAASPSYFAYFPGRSSSKLPPFFHCKATDKPIPESIMTRLSPAERTKYVDADDWGKVHEARITPKQQAVEVYEDTIRTQVDPGLLEYAGGNTFRGRVFPIPAKGYHRLVLAYEETLPFAGGSMRYEFPLPDRHLEEMWVSVRVPADLAKKTVFLPRGATREDISGAAIYQHHWEDTRVSGNIVFQTEPPDSEVQVASGRRGKEGPCYFFTRLRPALPEVKKEEPFARHAVFLLDTSASEHPDRFDVSVRLLKSILADKDIRHFNVLCFNVGACWVEPGGWLPNTPEGVKKALGKLDGLLLEGATDLSCALDRLCAGELPLEKSAPLACFLLSDGHLTWGETEVAALVSRFEKRCPHPTRFFCYRVGLGDENAELFDALTRAGGGTFQCFGEGDLPGAASAHRRHCLLVDRVRVESDTKASEVLVAGRRAAVAPGGELVVTGKLDSPGPVRIVLEGRFQGEKVVRSWTVDTAPNGVLAARAWGEQAVASLQALGDPKLDDLITAYCQEFDIAGRTASFLVLEDESDYRKVDLATQREQAQKVDLAGFLEAAWSQASEPVPAKAAFGELLRKMNARSRVLEGPPSAPVRELFALLREEDFALPAGAVRGVLLKAVDVPEGYREGRERDREVVSLYLDEARRRIRVGDIDGGIRTLSSVVEEHPGRHDALRLVGYRLLDLGQPAHAARLFARVQRDRPFEPHSHRDLALALEQAGLLPLAALQYEIVLAGTWHSRFGEALKVVAREEYSRILRAILARKDLPPALRDFFEGRLDAVAAIRPYQDLRVSITWNTDNTDVDLWVIEPDGTKVFYRSPKSPSGGQVSADQTQGFGPERYQVERARRGEYAVVVHYYRANRNVLCGETHVSVVVERRDRPAERHTVILSKHDEQVEVCRVRF